MELMQEEQSFKRGDIHAKARIYRELDQSETMKTFYARARGLRSKKPFSRAQRAVILSFFDQKDVNPDNWLKDVKEGIRNPEAEVNEWIRGLSETSLADFSLKAMRQAMIRFCRTMKAEAPVLADLDIIAVSNPVLKRQPVPYSKGDIIDLLNASRNNRDRSIVLTASTTGMRLGSLFRLELRDIAEIIERKTGEPYAIHLRAEIVKTGIPYTCFTTEETAQALRLLVKQRGIINPNERVFGIQKSHIQHIFRRLVKASKLTGERTFHGLRKYCRTTLLQAGIEEGFIEALIGHASTSLSQIYTKAPTETLRAQYSKSLDLFSFYGTSNRPNQPVQPRIDIESLIDAKLQEAIAKIFPLVAQASPQVQAKTKETLEALLLKDKGA